MDPLSISSSLVALLQITSTVTSYLKAVHNVSDKIQKLLLEVSNIRALLTALSEIAKFAIEPTTAAIGAPWLSTLQTLGEKPSGPLMQCEILVKRLAVILEHGPGVSKVRHKLKLPFRAGEIDEILSALERLKSYFNLALQNDHIRLSQAIREAVTDIQDDTRYLRVEQQTKYTKELHEWLSPLNFPREHQEIRTRRQSGTCTWLLEHSAWTTWLEIPDRPLWCYGIPGAGKTIAASFIIDHLKETSEKEPRVVMFSYCRYDERKQQSAPNILGSFLRQLCQQSIPATNELQTVFDDHRSSDTKLSIQDMSAVLARQLRRLSHSFIIIDALDELERDTREQLLEAITSVTTGDSVHVLYLSRNTPATSILLCHMQQMEIRASDADVQAFLRDGIPSGSHLARHLRNDTAFHEIIIETITRSSQGMFLMAHFHLHSLLCLLSRRDVKKALDNLPASPADYYDNTMKRIFAEDGSEASLARKILSWLTNSFALLNISDLQVAVAIEPGDKELDGDAILEEDVLIRVCHGLVMLDQGIVRFVHYTTKEYFVGNGETLLPGGDETIASTCLTCIQFDMGYDHVESGGLGQIVDMPAYANRLQGSSLLFFKYEPFPISAGAQGTTQSTALWSYLRYYAASFWGFHAHKAFYQDAGKKFRDQVARYLERGDKLMHTERACLRPLIPDCGYARRLEEKISRWYRKKQMNSAATCYPALLCAASYGLKDEVNRILDSGVDISTQDHDQRTALHVAAGFEQLDMVKLLIDRGVDIKARDLYGLTAFHYIFQACTRYRRNSSIRVHTLPKVLINAGASWAYPEDSDRTPALVEACRWDQDLATLLLESGADVNTMHRELITGRILATPLTEAVVATDHDLVSLLLSYKADPNIRISRLYNRYKDEFPDPISSLLDRSNQSVDRVSTALQLAQRRNDRHMERLLLAAGADNDLEPRIL